MKKSDGKPLQDLTLWGAWGRDDVILYRMPDPMKPVMRGGELSGVLVPQQLDADGKPCGNPADFIGSFRSRNMEWVTNYYGRQNDLGSVRPLPLMVECKQVAKLGPKENPFTHLSIVQRAEMRRALDAGWLCVLILQVASKFYAMESSEWHDKLLIKDLAPLSAHEVQLKSRYSLNWLGPRAGLKSLPETWRAR